MVSGRHARRPRVSKTAALGFCAGADVAALFFGKAAVKTGSQAVCLRFASNVARHRGFRKLRKGPAEVAGGKEGAYVAIACVGRGPQQPAVAVVMSVTQNFALGKRMGSGVVAQLTTPTGIDACGRRAHGAHARPHPLRPPLTRSDGCA